MADAQRQSRLGSLQRLTLTLLITAQHKRLVRWIEIEANHVPEFGFEVRIARQFERPGQVWLNLIGGPNPLHARRRYAGLAGHRTHAPAGPVRRWLRRLGDDSRLLRIGNRRLRSATRRLLQSRQTQPGKPAFPANHRRSAQAHFDCSRFLTAACSTQQNNPRPCDHTLRRRRGVDHAFQFLALPAVDLQNVDWSAHAEKKIVQITFCHVNNETLH